MSANGNLESVKKGYEAFAAGDVRAVVRNWAEDLEWSIPGHSSVSGVYHGKDEVLKFFAKLAEKSYTTKPRHFLAEDNVVVVLTDTTIGKESDHQADVFTFRDGKIVKAESLFDTAQGERIWGTRTPAA